MQIIARTEMGIDRFKQHALDGNVFIYPTDTIYGIGGVYSEKMAETINSIKNRPPHKKLSCIAPSLQRIYNRYQDLKPGHLEHFMNQYHAVTFIFSPDEPGWRIIQDPMQKYIDHLGVPFISTSVNPSGEISATDINKVDKNIAKSVNFAIDDGTRAADPSVLVDVWNNSVIPRN